MHAEWLLTEAPFGKTPRFLFLVLKSTKFPPDGRHPFSTVQQSLAACDLQCAGCDLQSAVCNLQPGICSLDVAAWGLRYSGICSLLSEGVSQGLA